MTPYLAQIWRHPIKAHGREALSAVTLEAGRCLPWDRTWAVAHEASQADGSEWVPCANFSRGAKAPQLNAISAKLDEDSQRVTLFHPHHPDTTDISFDPDTEAARFLDWVRPLMPTDRAPSTRILRVPGRGMTDSDFPSISILGLSSLRALGQKLGQPDLSPLRFRGNLWIEGTAPWEEFDWIGREVKIGGAVLRVRERITRCRATEVNPETGHRDAATLQALEEGWDHRDLGVYAEVIEGGLIELNDRVTLQ